MQRSQWSFLTGELSTGWGTVSMHGSGKIFHVQPYQALLWDEEGSIITSACVCTSYECA